MFKIPRGGGGEGGAGDREPEACSQEGVKSLFALFL